MLYEEIEAVEAIIAKRNESVAQRMDHMLQLGRDKLKMGIGVVSQIRGDNYLVSRCITPPNDFSIQNGQSMLLRQSYGSIVVAEGGLVYVEDMRESMYRSHTAFRNLGWNAYIAVPLIIGVQIFGALEFANRKPRSQLFTEYEFNMLYIMGAALADLITSDMEEQQERMRQMAVRQAAAPRDNAIRSRSLLARQNQPAAKENSNPQTPFDENAEAASNAAPPKKGNQSRSLLKGRDKKVNNADQDPEPES